MLFDVINRNKQRKINKKNFIPKNLRRFHEKNNV